MISIIIMILRAAHFSQAGLYIIYNVIYLGNNFNLVE